MPFMKGVTSMTLENETEQVTDEGTGATEGSQETQSASEETSSTQASKEESSAPSVDWSTIDAEELYKNRPELKPKSLEEIRAEVLASDEVKKEIQSAKDKEINLERRRRNTEAKARDKAEASRKAAEEKRRLREEEDYEGLGKYVDAEERDNEELLRSADLFKQTGEDWIRQNPKYQILGDDRVDEIIDSVKRRGGTFFEFQVELGEELANKRADDARAEASKTIEERVNEAVEAALAAAGVEQRSKDTEEGKTASETIAKGGTHKQTQKARDWKESADLYNEGEISWAEHQPFHEAHMKELNR